LSFSISSTQLKKTRIELQDLKSQLGIAETGKDLLEDRLGALLDAFSKQVKQLYQTRQRLALLGQEAKKSLALARAVDRRNLALSAMAATDSLEIEVKTDNVMGVIVPSVKLIQTVSSKEQISSFVASSELVDRTIDLFKKQLEVLIDLASQELAIAELGKEIRKTRHRFNALEKIMMPELKNQIQQILLSLEEKERDELSKLRIFMKEK